MRRCEGGKRVPVALERVAGLELLEPNPVGQLSEDPLQRSEQVDEPRGPVDRQVELPPPEREGLQHPRQAEVMVGVVMRQEDLAELDEPDRRAEHLALGPLGAIEEQAFAAPANEQP